LRRIRIAIILVFTLALLCLPLVSDQRPHIIDVKNSEVLGADIFSEGVQSTELEEYRVSDSPLPSVLPPVPYQHEPTWNHMYGYENHVQAAEDHVLCSDGGYALVGVSGFDIRVDRTDSFGIHQWNRTYGGVEFESSSAILENSSGGFIIAGYTRSYGAGDFDVWILRIDAIGNLLWNTTFGGTGSDYAQSMIECNDGGYAIIGYTTSFGAGETDVWLIRLDNDGNHLWNATYGGTQFDYGTDLVQHPDNGFVIGGYSGPPGDYDFYCIRTNSTGHSLWERTYVGPSYDLCHSVWRASNGIIVLAGEGYNPVSGSTDGRILFLDNDGDLMWDYFYGGTRLDVFRDMIACDAGGYALCPHCQSKNVGRGILGIAKEEKEDEIPKLPLVIDDEFMDIYEVGTLTSNKLTGFVDRHKRRMGAMPAYIGFTKELFDTYSSFLYNGASIETGPQTVTILKHAFEYRGEYILVKVID